MNPTISRLSAAPQPSTEVSPAPSVEPASATAPVTSAVTTPADAQEHRYSDAWSYDARGHWHECPDDGERAGEAEHDFKWTTITAHTRKAPGEERGVCSDCGYQVLRELPFGGSDDLISAIPIEYPLIAIPGLILILVGIQEIRVVRRRNRGE